MRMSGMMICCRTKTCNSGLLTSLAIKEINLFVINLMKTPFSDFIYS